MVERANAAGSPSPREPCCTARPPERHWVHDVRSIVIWGILLPLVILCLAWPTGRRSLVWFWFIRSRSSGSRGGSTSSGCRQRDAWLYSAACVVGRFPNAVGLLRYASNRLLGWRQSLIEYKSTAIRIQSDQRV